MRPRRAAALIAPWLNASVRHHQMRTSGALRLLLPLLVAAALASCAQTGRHDERQNRLVGCWRGEGYQPIVGRSTEWLMNRRSDGTFTIEFRLRYGFVQIEEGTWLDLGTTYVTHTLKIDGEPVDGNDPEFMDTYELRSVTDEGMEYYHLRTHITFKSQKVACRGSDA